MDSKTPIQHQREAQSRLFRNRCLWLVGFFTVIILALGVRLVQMQWANQAHYRTLSENNLLTYIPIPPSRGLITDRNGTWLAINKPTHTLALMPNRRQELVKTIKKLQTIIPISEREKKAFFKSLYQYRHYQPIPLKTKLTDREVALFYTDQYRLPGTLIETQLIRDYPEGSTVGPLLGYVGKINNRDKARIHFADYQAQPIIGKTGLEYQYENILHGEAGADMAQTNANGHIMQLLKHKAGHAGNNLQLTLDLRLQKKAQSLLKDQEGAIVMLDPRNGEIQAMVSGPTFDNNLFSGGISQHNYDQLLNDERHPLFNRALRGRFAPGSTIKPFYALMALNDGFVSKTYSFYDKGRFQVPGTKHVFHDWHASGHGWVNISKAIEVSCDVFFYKLANAMGIKRLNDSLFDFGFGEKTDIDLPHELSGILPTPEWKRGNTGKNWYTGDTIETGIGQGFFSATPLQLASATGALAMRGKHYKPHLLRAQIQPDGSVIKKPIEELAPTSPIKKDAWNTVVSAMRTVIDGRLGTAVRFGPHRHFTVAGKTGTAQVYGHTRDEERAQRNLPKKLRNNHLFIAFAPATNPTIAIAVIVEHSANADKKAGILLREYFRLQREDAKKKEATHASK